MFNHSHSPRKMARIGAAIATLASLLLPNVAVAAGSSWSPTMLVNTESFQTIDSGDGSTNIELRFGTSTQTIKFLTTGKFQFSHGISVLGNMSGTSLTVDKSATVSGTLLVKTSITSKGVLSGATIYGGGLGTCNGANQKLLYNVATGLFSCGTDLNTGSGNWSNTGSLQNSFDARYVNQSGDTMTGALNVQAVMSGYTLRVGAGGAGIQGPVAISGAVRTDNDLTINDDQTATDVTLTFGSDGSNETIKWMNTLDKFQFSDDISVVGSISGSSIRVDGAAEVHGALSASGTVRTDSNIVINDDQTAADAVLTFGNASGNQTMTFLNAFQKFQLSRGVSVLGTISGSSLNVDRNATIGGTLTASGAIRTKGNLSGSTLTVDGDTTLHGITYQFPNAQGAANSVLRNDGAGGLSWATALSSSGDILSFHPEYPNAVYFSSGSSFVGQLTGTGGVANIYDNFYKWTSTRSTIQDYWVAVRGQVPATFTAWDPARAIEFRYKTGLGTAADNHVTVRMADTANAAVTLSNTGGLVSTAGATVNMRITGGTWTPRSYFTLYVKMAAKNTTNAAAYAGFVNFNMKTTAP